MGIFPFVTILLNGVLAQLGERNAGSVEVIGSIPIGSTIFRFLLLLACSQSQKFEQARCRAVAQH